MRRPSETSTFPMQYKKAIQDIDDVGVFSAIISGRRAINEPKAVKKLQIRSHMRKPKSW